MGDLLSILDILPQSYNRRWTQMGADTFPRIFFIRVYQRPSVVTTLYL
jgi:hypothetical protein